MAKKSLKKNWLNQYTSGTSDVQVTERIARDENGNAIMDQNGQPVIEKTSAPFYATTKTDATKSAAGHPYLKYKRDFETSNPKGEYILNRVWSPGMPMPDDILTNYPTEFDEDYKKEQDKYIAQQVFKNNPIKKGETRGQYLDRLAQYTDETGKSRISTPLEEILSLNSNQSKSAKENLFHKSLEGIKRLALDFVDGRDDHLLIEHIATDKNLSRKEKEETLKRYVTSPVLSTIGEVGNAASPLMIPFNATTGAAYTTREGEEGYTPLSGLSGDLPANEADIQTQIMADPLNLLIPAGEALEVGSKVGNLIDKGQEAFKGTRLGKKVEWFKEGLKHRSDIKNLRSSEYALHTDIHQKDDQLIDLIRELNQVERKQEDYARNKLNRPDLGSNRTYRSLEIEANKLRNKIKEIEQLQDNAWPFSDFNAVPNKNLKEAYSNEINIVNENPLYSVTNKGQGEIINFNTGDKVVGEVKVPLGSAEQFKLNPETRTVEKNYVSSNDKAEVSDNLINTHKENINYIENLFPGAKVFGSSRGVAEGGLPHISHDYDVFITQTDYNNLVKGKYNHIQSKKPGVTELHDIFNGKYDNILDGKYKEQGHVDFNIIQQDKNGNAIGERANELYRQFYPDEYYEQAKNLKPGEQIKIPYTPKKLLEDLNPTVKTILDAYESSRDKHINRIDSYLSYGKPEVILEAQNQYIKSLVGSKGTLGIQFPTEAFSDIEKNKQILKDTKFTGDIDAVSKDPLKMQAAINDYYINTTVLIRGVDKSPEGALRQWVPEMGGGNAMGAGLNHTLLGEDPVNKTYLSFKQVALDLKETADPLEYIDHLRYQTDGFYPLTEEQQKIAKDIIIKNNIHTYNEDIKNSADFINIIKTNSNGPKALEEFANATGKKLVITTKYNINSPNSANYTSTLKDFDDAVDTLVYGLRDVMPNKLKSKLLRLENIQNKKTGLNLNIDTYEKFLKTRNELTYDLKKLRVKYRDIDNELQKIEIADSKFKNRIKNLNSTEVKDIVAKMENLKKEKDDLNNQIKLIVSKIDHGNQVDELVNKLVINSLIGTAFGVGIGLPAYITHDMYKKRKEKYYSFYQEKSKEYNIPYVSKEVFEKGQNQRTAEENNILKTYSVKINNEREVENLRQHEVMEENPNLTYEEYVKKANEIGYTPLAKDAFLDAQRIVKLRQNEEIDWLTSTIKVDQTYEDYLKEAAKYKRKPLDPYTYDDYKNEIKTTGKIEYADGGYVRNTDQESAEKAFYDSLMPLMEDKSYYGIEKEKELKRLKEEQEKNKALEYFESGKNDQYNFTEALQNMIRKEEHNGYESNDSDYFTFSKKKNPMMEESPEEEIGSDIKFQNENVKRAYVALVNKFKTIPETRDRANQMAKLVLAQSAFETGDWASSAYLKANNYSGIKFYGQKGRQPSEALAPASEENGYRRPYVQYDSPEDWADDMVNLLAKRYPKALAANTVDDYALRLREGRYYGLSDVKKDAQNYSAGMKSKIRSFTDPQKSFEKLSASFEKSVKEYKEKYPNRPTPTITSGLRTRAEQQALYDNRKNNPYPVSRPGTSEHEFGRAIDVGFSGNHTDQDYRNFAEIMGKNGVNWLGDYDKVHFQLAEFGDGGIVDNDVINDDMGQWAHPGEVTRINSNRITTKEVHDHLLGIGADGEKRMMHPEEEHLFNEGPVTEYPMKRRGREIENKTGRKSDYDMLGYATHHPLGALKHMINPERFHATDEYKRPNHMTFSDESKYSDNEHPGGHWSQTPDGKWTFTATDFNIENAGGPERYKQWWDQTEGKDGNVLILPQHKRGGVTWLNEYAQGGEVFSTGGEKHKVYKKESPTGNGKGVKGHIMVTHPTKDKGKWDTIDLTEIAGAKTVAQGVASTKKWHEENPEYQQGGPTTRYSYVLDDDSGNTVFDDNGNPIIINPTTNYTVPEWLPQVNITAPRLPKPGGIPTSNASQSDASLAVDLALDAAQFVPGPLGTAASVVGMGKNLYEGDYVGAGLDLANIVTLGGAKWFDAAAKFARAAAKGRKAASMADKAKLLEYASNPNLWRTTGLTRDLSKVDVTGYTPTYKNEPKKAPNLISKKDGGWLNNYK